MKRSREEKTQKEQDLINELKRKIMLVLCFTFYNISHLGLLSYIISHKTGQKGQAEQDDIPQTTRNTVVSAGNKDSYGLHDISKGEIQSGYEGVVTMKYIKNHFHEGTDLVSDLLRARFVILRQFDPDTAHSKSRSQGKPKQKQIQKPKQIQTNIPTKKKSKNDTDQSHNKNGKEEQIIINEDYFIMLPYVLRDMQAYFQKQNKTLQQRIGKVICTICKKQRQKFQLSFVSCDCGNNKADQIPLEPITDKMNKVRLVRQIIEKVSKMSRLLSKQDRENFRKNNVPPNLEHIHKSEREKEKEELEEKLMKYRLKYPHIKIWSDQEKLTKPRIIPSFSEFCPKRKFGKISEMDEIMKRRKQKKQQEEKQMKSQNYDEEVRQETGLIGKIQQRNEEK